MITEQDLQAAIAECEGVRNPTSTTCLKLAAYYTIQERMFGKDVNKSVYPRYSFANEPEKQVDKVISYLSDTDFSQAIHGKYEDDVFEVIDELMSVLQATNPRLYDGVIRKIEG